MDSNGSTVGVATLPGEVAVLMGLPKGNSKLDTKGKGSGSTEGGVCAVAVGRSTTWKNSKFLALPAPPLEGPGLFLPLRSLRTLPRLPRLAMLRLLESFKLFVGLLGVRPLGVRLGLGVRTRLGTGTPDLLA